MKMNDISLSLSTYLFTQYFKLKVLSNQYNIQYESLENLRYFLKNNGLRNNLNCKVKS